MLLGYYSDNPNGFVTGKLFSADAPAPTIMAAGMGGGSLGHWHLLRDERAENMKRPKTPGKPPYRVPSMAEVNALKWNGMTVASTFSGCGGSCLGYRIAGFRVAWANEFVPAAQESYLANAAPESFLDKRDIKLIQPENILKKLGIKKDELDLLDGSPPCQAFSTAGKRHKGWGQVKRYEGGHEQLNETLFGEWLRLLRGLAPRTFVAENVSGLVKGTAKGTFLEILRDMKAAGYRVTCRLLDAQWLGVPQQRVRAIFVGAREDLGVDPTHPTPLPWRYSVREAIPWIAGQAITQQQGAPGVGKKPVSDGRPLPTVCSSQAQQFIVEPESDMNGLSTGREWDRISPGEQSSKYFQLVKPSLGAACPSVTAAGGNAGLASVCHPLERRKFSIAELKRLCAFPDDFTLTGSYAQRWERLGNSVPPVMMFWIARTVRDEVLRRAAGLPPWVGDPSCLVAGTKR